MKKTTLKKSDVTLEWGGDDDSALVLVDDNDRERVVIYAEDIPILLARLKEIAPSATTGWIEQ